MSNNVELPKTPPGIKNIQTEYDAPGVVSTKPVITGQAQISQIPAEEVEKYSSGVNAPPGSFALQNEERSRGVEIEGLGSLDDVVMVEPEDEEGEGGKVVILHDLVKGFVKGRIVRISKVVGQNLWDKKDDTLVKMEAKRLIQLGAIRVASPEEENLQVVQVDNMVDLESFRREQLARINAQKELEKLRKDAQKEVKSTSVVINNQSKEKQLNTTDDFFGEG